MIVPQQGKVSPPHRLVGRGVALGVSIGRGGVVRDATGAEVPGQGQDAGPVVVAVPASAAIAAAAAAPPPPLPWDESHPVGQAAVVPIPLKDKAPAQSGASAKAPLAVHQPDKVRDDVGPVLSHRKLYRRDAAARDAAWIRAEPPHQKAARGEVAVPRGVVEGGTTRQRLAGGLVRRRGGAARRWRRHRSRCRRRRRHRRCPGSSVRTNFIASLNPVRQTNNALKMRYVAVPPVYYTFPILLPGNITAVPSKTALLYSE